MARTLLLISLLAGCGNSAKDAAVDYQNAMAPVLQRNSALGQEFLDLASKVKQGQLDAAATAARFEQNAVPAAKDLALQVAEITPRSAPLQESHARLVKAWASRAESYAAMTTALKSGDRSGFEAAQARTLQVRLDEEAWLAAVNAATTPHGVTLQLYP